MKSITRQKGQSTVEFAIVLPLLLFLVCAIMEFGVFMFDYLSVNEIAREMARTLSVGSSDTTLMTKINARFAGMNHVQVQIHVPSSDATVNASIATMLGQLTNVAQSNKNETVDASVATGDIEVIVTASPRFTIPLISNLVPAAISSGPVVMRMEI